MELPRTFGAASWLVARVVCYVALMALLGSVAIYWGVFALNLCRQAGDAGVRCGSGVIQSLASFSITYVVAAVFLLLPGLLAVGGIIFLVRDAWGAVERRRR